MKKWYEQKTTWMGILSLIAGGILCATGNVAIGAPMVVNGGGMIFGRAAIDKVMGTVTDVAGRVSEVADAVKVK